MLFVVNNFHSLFVFMFIVHLPVYNRLSFADVLEKARHKIHLEPINDWNVVELIVRGQKVFTCDIRDLDFGDELQILL